MNTLILWFGFVGAWSLVAGPIHQAAVELHEQEVDRDALASAGERVTNPPEVSAWWWLVPPVKYLLERRRTKAYRKPVFEALGPDERADYIDYMSTATGWLFVATGGVGIAAKETWELLEHYELHVWLWIVLMVVLLLSSTAYAASSVGRADTIKGGARRPAAKA